MSEVHSKNIAPRTAVRLSSARVRWGEKCIQGFLFICAFISVLTTVGIVAVLLVESVKFFEHISLTRFLFGLKWSPLFYPPEYGILPLMSGTLLVAVGSGVVAIPLGVLGAIYLSEYASTTVRSWLKPVLEVLAGIPTVVYGFFALTFVTPMLRLVFPATEIFNAASAAIVVGIMTLPMVVSLSDDAMRSVPRSLREAGHALAGTKFDVSARIVLPAALSGIMASFVLALSRAVGETMAVTIAAGARPNLTFNPLESIQTMTAFIAQVSLGDTPAGSVEYQAIFAVGLMLFCITFMMNLAGSHLLGRFREQYE